jgi:hypothetical protein
MNARRNSHGLPLPPKYKKSYRKVQAVCGMMARGYSRSAAAGKAGIGLAELASLANEFPIVRDKLDLAKLQRLHHLETGFLDEKAKMPQVVARIFALKNANSDEWQDNPGRGYAPGLSQNITVITGVPESPDSQQPQVLLEATSPPSLQQRVDPMDEHVNAGTGEDDARSGSEEPQAAAGVREDRAQG